MRVPRAEEIHPFPIRRRQDVRIGIVIEEERERAGGHLTEGRFRQALVPHRDAGDPDRRSRKVDAPGVAVQLPHAGPPEEIDVAPVPGIPVAAHRERRRDLRDAHHAAPEDGKRREGVDRVPGVHDEVRVLGRDQRRQAIFQPRRRIAVQVGQEHDPDGSSRGGQPGGRDPHARDLRPVGLDEVTVRHADRTGRYQREEHTTPPGLPPSCRPPHSPVSSTRARGSRARHRYQDATVRWGRQRSPRRNTCRGVGSARVPKARRNPLRMP